MSHGTWAHRLVTVAVRPLAGTGVTPNQLTTLRLATGIGAAALFAVGEPAYSQWAGGVWLLSMLLDRADGILARLTGATSAWGHVFDLIADFTATTLLFVGLGLGARNGAFGAAAPWLGVLAAVSVALVFWLLYRLDRMAPAGHATVPTAGGFDPDDTLFVVAPLAWAGWLEGFLAAAAMGAPIAAVAVAFIYARARRRVTATLS